MSNYRRLISYIYAYEGGVKGKNIGFAKIETRGIQCKITVSVKRIYVGGNDIGVYLLAGDQEIFLGNIFIRSGSGEFRSVVSVNNIENSTVSMDQCYGLTIHDVKNTWRSYTTIWEDAVAHAAEVDLENTTLASQKTDQASATDNQIKKAVREIEEEFPLKPSLDNREDKEQYTQQEVEQSETETVRAENVKIEKKILDYKELKFTEPIMEKSWKEVSGESEDIEQQNMKKKEPKSKEERASEEESVLEEEPISEEESVFEEEPISEEELLSGEKSESEEESLSEEEPVCQEKLVSEEEPEPKEEPVSRETHEQEIQQAKDTKDSQQDFIREKGNTFCEPYGPYNLQETMENTPTVQRKEREPLPELGNKEELEHLRQSEEVHDSPHELVWEKLKREHTRILAFDYEQGCEILTIKPNDIGLLPRDVWIYGNNSFLLHGYYNHRYLILAKLLNPTGIPRYLLGIPGHYYSNERYMASMFGFPHFVLSKEQPMEDGRFGYWYTDIKLGS